MLSDGAVMIERVYRYRSFYITARYYGDTRQNMIIAQRDEYPMCAIFGRDVGEVKKDIDRLWREWAKTGTENGR